MAFARVRLSLTLFDSSRRKRRSATAFGASFKISRRRSTVRSLVTLPGSTLDTDLPQPGSSTSRSCSSSRTQSWIPTSTPRSGRVSRSRCRRDSTKRVRFLFTAVVELQANAFYSTEKLEINLKKKASQRRYLESLCAEGNEDVEETHCTICSDVFTAGSSPLSAC